jgi:hypothetical protein
MEIKVRNAAQALDLIFSYLRQQNVSNIPETGRVWQERKLYSPGIEDYAVTSKLCAAGAWLIEIYQGVAPISRTVYKVTIFNSEIRCYWQGSVQADGTLTSISPVKQLSEKEALEIAAGISRKLEIPAPRPGTYGH